MNVSGYATDVVKMWIDNKQITKKVYSYIYFSFITLPVRRCQLFVYFVSTICLQSHHHLRSNWKLKIFMKIIGVLFRASSLYYIYDICKYKYYIPQQKNTVGKAQWERKCFFSPLCFITQLRGSSYLEFIFPPPSYLDCIVGHMTKTYVGKR